MHADAVPEPFTLAASSRSGATQPAVLDPVPGLGPAAPAQRAPSWLMVDMFSDATYDVEPGVDPTAPAPAMPNDDIYTLGYRP